MSPVSSRPTLLYMYYEILVCSTYTYSNPFSFAANACCILCKIDSIAFDIVICLFSDSQGLDSIRLLFYIFYIRLDGVFSTKGTASVFF